MAAVARIPPNHSLYITNLPDKLQKEDLRRELYMLFSTNGPVLSINVRGGKKMRGQAHVLFTDPTFAGLAKDTFQGFEFFGLNLKIEFAKTRSLVLSHMTGEFEEPKTATAPQQTSSFPAPPGSLPAPVNGFVPPGMGGSLPPPPGMVMDAPSPQGVKRKHEGDGEESVAKKPSPQTAPDEESEGDAPMEESEGEAMEMSDEDEDDDD